MKNPFFNFSAAEKYLSKAEKNDNQRWETKALKATLAFLKKNKQEADQFIKEAEQHNGSPLTKEQVQEIPYLNQFIKESN